MTSSDSRLRGDQFEHTPKRVIMADLFKDRVDALADPVVAARYVKLRDCISKGRVVPAHFYRRSTKPDQLLLQDGIKHLHLDGGGGDILLFAVEYEDAVVFLEINSHKHFESDPPGSVLRSLHANCLREQDGQAQQRAAKRVAAMMEERANLKSRLKPRRSRKTHLNFRGRGE